MLGGAIWGLGSAFSYESISLQRFGREDAVRGVYLVVIVASPQADCGESKQRVNDLFLHNFHFFLC